MAQNEEAYVNSKKSNISRGHKTKGSSYKDRYVDKVCPECNHTRAYSDTWRTRIAYSCMKRDCRHKWYETIPTDMQNAIEE